VRLRPTAILPIVALLVAGACSTGSGSPASTTVSAVTTTAPSGDSSPTVAGVGDSSTTIPAISVPTLQWSACGDGLECTSLVVPLDYFTPGDESVTIPVVRHVARKAKQRIGSLLVNPGGPGFGGTYLAKNAVAIFSDDLLDRFDIVGWDPRGTGDSTPAIDCIDNYDPYFAVDPTPDTDAERQANINLAKEFAAACEKRSGSLLSHVSTQDAARDMDTLRKALGEDKISYFGFSYGSELGATWATMFPTTVRAAVFDGAADPNASAVQGMLDQAKGFEIALNAFLADCVKKCAFADGGDPGKAFDSVLAQIDANSYPTASGRPALNLGIAYTAIADAMYAPELWPVLDQALAAAHNGDGAALLRLNDDYYRRNPDGTYSNELEAFLAISCADDRGPTSVAEVDKYNADLERVAPRLGVSFENGYACVFWPVESAPNLVVTGKGAGPILVIGTTNDPATPFESSEKMARTLEHGIFVKVTGNGHTGYTKSPCAKKLVDKYLVKGEVPTGDVECD
jgi:hypothetical protein